MDGLPKAAAGSRASPSAARDPGGALMPVFAWRARSLVAGRARAERRDRRRGPRARACRRSPPGRSLPVTAPCARSGWTAHSPPARGGRAGGGDAPAGTLVEGGVAWPTRCRRFVRDADHHTRARARAHRAPPGCARACRSPTALAALAPAAAFPPPFPESCAPSRLSGALAVVLLRLAEHTEASARSARGLRAVAHLPRRHHGSPPARPRVPARLGGRPQ